MAKKSKKSDKSKGGPGRPPKLDKDAKRAAKELMSQDSSMAVRRAVTLALFAAASWPTVTAFGSGALAPAPAALRVLAAGLFATVSVAVVSMVVDTYRGPRDGGSPDSGDDQ